MQSPNYQRTMIACFVAYMVQAIVNNFVPLLFVTFQKTYDIPMTKITLLITLNFLIQLVIDFLSAGFVDKIGYKTSVMIAHICAAAGFVFLTMLPEVLPDAFAGILIAVIIYAVGGGLIEVLISPIVEACPTDNKEKAMSLLHSFYCWGQVTVVLASTVFFATAGIQNWKIITIIWALIPLANMIVFAGAPIYPLHEENDVGVSVKELVTQKVFWILMVMMLCAGASEMAVSQWASLFAEKGLGVSKAVGDLAGPMSFAILMGISRVIYGKYGDKMDLNRCMAGSCLLCIASYLCIVIVPDAAVNLVGCAICGFSVGILWPGTFSKASSAIRRGGTALYAFLALAGDVGCSGGPTLAGLVTSLFHDNLKMGILAAIVFPIVLLAGLSILHKGDEKMHNINVREYRETDIPMMNTIWNDVVEDGIAFPQEEFLTEETGKEFFSAQTYTAVAEDMQTGEILGLYILHPNNVGRCGHICNASYAVAKASRGRHIGEKLVKDCQKQAPRFGYKILQFNAVVASNVHARHLYERLGLIQLGVIPGGFRRKDGVYEDICPYYCKL